MRTTKNLRWAIVLAGVLAVAGTMLAACNAATDADPTPVKTFWITPASGAQATANAAQLHGDTPPGAPTATPVVVPTQPATAETPSGGGAATTLQLTASGTQFEETELSAPAGIVTIQFENKDAGILHNVHVFKGTSASGESVGQTKLQAGPTSETLALQLAPGTYFYQCDAHPTSMKGTLTVS